MLRHKMLQDLKKNKWQFISILLMAFLGVYIFTGVGGEWAGVENFRTKYYSETNLADGWIYGEGFSNDDLKAVQSIDGVTQAEKRCYLQIEGADDVAPQIYFYGLNENSINKPYVVDGEEFSTTANDKVWIAKQFADAKGLKVGDEYTFKFDSTEFSLKIAGLVYSSEYQYFSNENDLWPDYNNIGFAYASVNALPIKQYIIDTVSSDKYTVSELVDEFAKEYPEIADNADMLKGMSKESIVKFLKLAKDDEFKDALPYTQIVFTSSKPAKNLADEIESKLSGNYAAFVTRAENSGITMLDSEMAQHKNDRLRFPDCVYAYCIACDNHKHEQAYFKSAYSDRHSQSTRFFKRQNSAALHGIRLFSQPDRFAARLNCRAAYASIFILRHNGLLLFSAAMENGIRRKLFPRCTRNGCGVHAGNILNG